MSEAKPTETFTHIHFIGVGGTGMSALALVLLARKGILVTGSDLKESRYTRELTAAGMRVYFGHAAENLGTPDVVVVSTAITENNPELIEARRRKIPVWPRAKMLAWLCRDARTVAIAGTHGKTSTSSMIASLLHNLGLDPSFCIGGQLVEFESNAHAGSGDFFVVEADESDRSFLYLSPHIAVITNIEPDHLDTYANLDDIEQTFFKFMQGVDEDGALVVFGEDEHALRLAQASGRRVVRYGMSEDDDYRVLSSERVGFGSRFRLRYPDGSEYEAEIKLPGQHMITNAAAALAVADILGCAPAQATQTLAKFTGVHRRFDLVGISEADHLTVVDDYAHHPTEIRSTLAGAARLGFGRVVVLFQPHRYSRTQSFGAELGEALHSADKVVLTDVYSAGEVPIPGISGRTVLEELLAEYPRADAAYFPHRGDLVPYLEQTLHAGDLLITMGAGDVTLLGPQFLEHHVAALTQRTEREQLRASD